MEENKFTEIKTENVPEREMESDLRDGKIQTEKIKKIGFPKWLKIILRISVSLFVFLLLIVVGMGVFVYFVVIPPAQKLQQTGIAINQEINSLQLAAKSQNLSQLKLELTNLRESFGEVRSVLNEVVWVKKIPQFEIYWEDANSSLVAGLALIDAGELGIEALVPYADLLGFSVERSLAVDGTKSIVGNNSKSSAVKPSKETETAEDRIQFVVTTLDKLVPQLDAISSKLEIADRSLQKIDPNRYPEFLQIPKFLQNYVNLPNGPIEVRSQLVQLTDLVSQSRILATDARPVLEVAPYILGNDKTRRYLVLFQNDAELRPTGGFLTAYSLLTVNKGKIYPGISKDIYDLDTRYTSKLKAPQPLIDYIPDPYSKERASGKIPRLRIRDSNLSPDFKVAMDLFYDEYKKTGSPQVDGIIAVDTQFLLGLLKVIGPIGVGGVGNFSAEIIPECNCPQVVYSLESAISYESSYIRKNRKAIIGPLMHSVLANAMGTPKNKISQLVQTVLDAIKQKHLLMYFTDSNVQKAIEAFNLGGRINQTTGDYLMIVDTNFAGAKSNLYIDQEVELNIKAGESSAIHELTITYKNPQPHDGWLNGDFRNWVRVLVPKGSKLLSSQGSEVEMMISDDFDKTVYEGFLVVRPKGLAKLTLKYEVNLENKTKPYSLLIQKQGGTKNFFYMVNVNGKSKEFELDEDKELIF